MSINLRILVPEETTNYILNPSPRYGTTGWSAVGSSVTRVLTRSRFSIASLQVTTTGAALNEGTFFRVNDLSGVQDWVTASAYVRGAGKVRIRLINNPNGAQWFSDPVSLTDERWIRIEVSGRCNGSNDMRLYVETADLTAKATTFYVDGAQMERKPYATTYVDGSQPGCRWNIQAYATQSTRDESSRAGGRWVALAGPCRPNNDIYVTLLGGFGMPSVQNQTQPWSNSPGSFFQNSKVRDRTLTLSFFVKKEDLYPSGPPDLTPLHEMRQQIIDIIKPDTTGGDEAFLLEYESTEANRKLYVRVRYDGGLDGSWDVRNQWVNAFPLRLLAVDPFWFEDDQEVVQIRIKTAYNIPNNTFPLWGRIDSVWKPIVATLGLQLPSLVKSIAVSPDGLVYVGGSFSSNGFYRIATWNGKYFTDLGGATSNGIVEGIAFGLDGSMYVVGSFTTIGGIAANRVARYNPATGAWSAMGTGWSNTTRSVCVAQNGQIYVGGSQGTAGGVTTGGIARWDGLQWRTVGAVSGTNGTVNSVVRANDDKTLYIGGTFQSPRGTAAPAIGIYNGVASIDIETNLISPLGYGFNEDGIGGAPTVNSLSVGMDGTLYAVGNFRFSGAPPYTTSLLRAAKYSGGQLWTQLGAGLDQAAEDSAIGPNGELYVGGAFSFSGEIRTGKLVRWQGNAWNSMQIYYGENVAQVTRSVTVHPNGDIYLGTDPSGDALYEVPAETIVTNPGSAATFPLLYYKDSGRIRFIGNNRTKQGIYLDLNVFDDEEIFFDFARGKIVSTVRGDVSYSILPGSEIRSIYCLPGENTFSVLVTNDVNGIMQLRLQPQHWSVDAVVEAEEL